MNKKYFIAIVLPEPTQSAIEEIKQRLFTQFSLRGALRSPSHITLHRPFEWKEEKEDELIEKLHAFEWSKETEIHLENFNCFTPRVIYVDVLENENLNDLHNDLKWYAHKNLKLFNETGDMRGFKPHVTIAFRDLKKNKFEEIWQSFKNEKINFSFPYTGFSLLKLETRWEEIKFFKK